MLDEKDAASTQNYRYRLRVAVESCPINSLDRDTKQSSEGREGHRAALAH